MLFRVKKNYDSIEFGEGSTEKVLIIDRKRLIK